MKHFLDNLNPLLQITAHSVGSDSAKARGACGSLTVAEMALIDAPQHQGGPTLLGVPMKQVSLITVSAVPWNWIPFLLRWYGLETDYCVCARAADVPKLGPHSRTFLPPPGHNCKTERFGDGEKGSRGNLAYMVILDHALFAHHAAGR